MRHRLVVGAFMFAPLFIGGMFMLGRATASPPCGDGEGACWENYYTEVLRERGAQTALADIERRVAQGDGAAAHCHPVLHLIGAHAAREYGSVAEAFKHASSVCRAGYYHGVLEGVFSEAGSDAVLSSLDSLCARVPGRERYSYEYFSCVHGIGHGLMAYEGHDVFASLEGCDRLAGTWEQESCYGGVFMENIMSDSPQSPSRFLRLEEPLYPCTAVAGRYRTQCYLMQSSYVLDVTGDFGAVFAACDGAEERYRRTCYESVGRDVSGVSGGSAEAVLAFCALGSGVATEACIIGAAVDFIQSVGTARAYELCRASGEHEQMCTSAIAAHATML